MEIPTAYHQKHYLKVYAHATMLNAYFWKNRFECFIILLGQFS